ncbi:MAG: NACHT domain-containing protein, partial [Bacteroidota bacterium]
LEKEAERSVFGESFSLNGIFIPLRAYYKVKKKGQKDEKIVVALEESLNNWLEDNNNEATIKVIQGEPGSGKSSFVKWWAARIVKERNISVLFFPLHHFNIHSNIKAGIGEYFKDADAIPLGFNPLEDTKTIRKMLLIFDGLDELVMQGKSSKEAANAFMQEIKDFCRLKNQEKPRFKVLVTGRPIAIQDTEAKLREGEQQILHLLPYYLNDKQKEEYTDPQGLLPVDQRHSWWNKFYAFKYKDPEPQNLPKELSTENMDKITTEPLLNYLVALSWNEAPEKFNEDTNINDIYYQLILGVYERAYDQRRRFRGLGDLTFDQFIQILEEIAICAWQGGDARLTTEREIEKHIKDKGLEDLLEEYKSSVKNGVSRLLTAFYFRKYGKEESESKDDTFENSKV